MAIYKLSKDTLTPLTETKLEAEGILERKHLQRLLRSQIKALDTDTDLMVVSEEFGDWDESNRRIDLLCVDKNANLVVVELKRTEDGGHMELQAIRYAAMISKMTFPQLISAYESHLKGIGEATEDAQNRILHFLVPGIMFR
jgi:RecB family endonuclease NucS